MSGDRGYCCHRSEATPSYWWDPPPHTERLSSLLTCAAPSSVRSAPGWAERVVTEGLPSVRRGLSRPRCQRSECSEPPPPSRSCGAALHWWPPDAPAEGTETKVSQYYGEYIKQKLSQIAGYVTKISGYVSLLKPLFFTVKVFYTARTASSRNFAAERKGKRLHCTFCCPTTIATNNEISALTTQTNQLPTKTAKRQVQNVTQCDATWGCGRLITHSLSNHVALLQETPDLWGGHDGETSSHSPQKLSLHVPPPFFHSQCETLTSKNSSDIITTCISSVSLTQDLPSLIMPFQLSLVFTHTFSTTKSLLR